MSKYKPDAGKAIRNVPEDDPTAVWMNTPQADEAGEQSRYVLHLESVIRQAIDTLDGNHKPIDWRIEDGGELLNKLAEHLEAYNERPPFDVQAVCDIIGRLIAVIDYNHDYDEHTCPNATPCGVCKTITEAKAIQAGLGKGGEGWLIISSAVK